jgi:hypothetical protein
MSKHNTILKEEKGIKSLTVNARLCFYTSLYDNDINTTEGVDRDIALLIADGVYNRLKSANIRECVRIARLAKSDSVQVNRIIDTFAKYGMN